MNEKNGRQKRRSLRNVSLKEKENLIKRKKVKTMN